MSSYQPSVTLHQQDGGITIQAFAELHGMTAKAIWYYIKAGRVVGARQDVRSKKWTIYPPAKLVDTSGDIMKRRELAACQTVEKPAEAALAPAEGGNLSRAASGGLEVVDVGTSPHGLPADGLQPMQETREGQSLAPPAKRGFNAFEGCAGRDDEHAANVYRDPETRRVLQSLREAAIRQHCEGIHYLRLEAREFSQLYAALDHERSRIRKLVGKGLVDLGNLRASDSVWQKLQTMCHEGKLL